MAEAALLVAAILLFGAASILWLRRLPVDYASSAGAPMKASASLAALLCVATTCLFLFGQTEGSSLLSRFVLVLSLVSAAYLLLNAGWGEAPQMPVFLTGLGVLLFLLASLAFAYFDVTVQMNAPNKVLFQLACLAGMLFTTEELRIMVGAPRRGLYLFSLGSAILLLGVATVPTLIAILAGAMEAPSWTPCYTALLGIFLYAVARMLSLTFTEEAPSEDSREQTVEETEEAREETEEA